MAPGAGRVDQALSVGADQTLDSSIFNQNGHIDLRQVLTNDQIELHVKVYGTAEPQTSTNIATFFSHDDVPELERDAANDRILPDLGFKTQYNKGSAMIRLVNYDGTQVHIMNASIGLVQLSRQYPRTKFTLQLDDGLFRLDRFCSVCVEPLPSPWFRQPHVQKITALELPGYGGCLMVDGQFLGSNHSTEGMPLVMYAITPESLHAEELFLLAASSSGRRAIFQIPSRPSPALQDSSSMTLRLRRGAAFAADCVLQTTQLLHHEPSGGHSRGGSSVAIAADGRPTSEQLTQHEAQYRIDQTIMMLKERYQRKYCSKGSPARFSDWKPPSQFSLWSAHSGFSDEAAGSNSATFPNQASEASRLGSPREQSGQQAAPGTRSSGAGGSDCRAAQPLLQMVQNMLTTVVSSRDAVSDRQADRHHPLLRKLEELRQLLTRASRQLAGPEALAASCAGVREAMDFITEEVRHLSTKLTDALGTDSFYDPRHAAQSERLLHDTWRGVNRTLGTAVTIASALLAMDSEGMSHDVSKDSRALPRQFTGISGKSQSGMNSGVKAPSDVSSTQGQLPGQQLQVELGADEARQLIGSSGDSNNALSEALERFALQQRELALERLTCPITAEIMVDPVKASDGHTYDRYNVFSVIDNGGHMPGSDSDSFRVMVDDIDLRGELFETVSGSDEVFRARREEFVSTVAAAEAAGDWAAAAVAAERALEMLPAKDKRETDIRATLERAREVQAARKKGF